MVVKQRGRPGIPIEESERVRRRLVQTLRDRYRGNQSAMARDLGLSQPTIGKLISGKNRFSMETVEALARLLDVTEASLRLDTNELALRTCIDYWTGRWSPSVIESAYKLMEAGTKHSAQEWRVRLDELAGTAQE